MADDLLSEKTDTFLYRDFQSRYVMVKENNTDEDIRRKNKDTFGQNALHWNKLANDRLFEMSKQLLGISLVILPITGSIILSDKTISPNILVLLVHGWISFLLSIISGFVNLWLEARYFQYLSSDSSNREMIWSRSDISVKNMDEMAQQISATKTHSSFLPLIFQIITIFIGVCFIMYVFIDMNNS